MPAFASASWQFDAPAGTTIDRADISIKLYRYGGAATDRWGVGLGDETGAYLLGGIGQVALSIGSRGSYFALAVPDRSSLRLGVVCANGAGCSVLTTGVAAAGYSRARADLYGARIRISDPSTPTLFGQSGALWTSDGWLSGLQPLSFSASDNVGVAELSAGVAGERRVLSSDCDYAMTVPCPASRQLATSFDTGELSDGSHTVAIAAVDSGGNRSSGAHQILVDNTAPESPGPPELAGAPSSSWRTADDFVLTYRNPTGGGGSPLSSHDVEICAVTAGGALVPSRCSVESRPGAPGVDAIAVPTAGRYMMRVRVNDELFKGQWGPWSPVLRFDDIVPGTPTVAFPSGWINRTLAAVPLELGAPSAAAAMPPSGYASYLVTVDGAEVTTVPAVGSGESGAFDIQRLADGHHSLEVRAVSGAGLATPALAASRGAIAKDVVAPVLAVTGAPPHGALVTSPVTLSMRAADEMSGMAPAIAPAPISSGGYIGTQAARSSLLLTPGSFAQLTPGDGEQLIQSYAADVAGNKSALQTFSYIQDTKLPTGGLRPVAAEHPALLDFFIDERCSGSVVVEISTTPGSWRPVATTSAPQRATALVPTDVWEPRIPYSVRALVSDCAGNSAVLVDWYGGPRSGTPIGTITSPPRSAVSARAEVEPASKGASASSAAKRKVTVRIVDGSGDPLADVQARIETQPWMTPATWTAVGSVRADSRGRATAPLTADSSLRIRAVVPGTELRDAAVSNIVYVTRFASTTIGANPRKIRAGHSVVLKGRLRGGLVPRGGFQVALYGKGSHSRGWVPVRTTVAVSSGGYWRTSYRFLRSSRGHFYFRIRTPSRPDYPFRSATSQSVRVAVRR